MMIRSTIHYLTFHNNVSWDLVVATILSPNKIRLNSQYGKNRFTFVKIFGDFAIEVHVKKDENFIWVINAFKMGR
ncbi:MAG: hypothetical protein COT15_01680 [Candidatus Diapherotrites archaeon CG08_land_8_20_14_0_20_34_12]|nr:MAG: hypothetical protein COT15_01680 [Candidatus Diapherotrites archaeon CG08_land_8_20_14_0_20_34_12]